MRVVLDCNVVVSAARVDGTCREVIDRVIRGHEIVVSGPNLSEYLTIARRPSQAPYRETMADCAKVEQGQSEQRANVIPVAPISSKLITCKTRSRGFEFRR